MSPVSTSVPYQPVVWWRDVFYPLRPNRATQGHTLDVATSVGVVNGHHFGLEGGAGPQPVWRQAQNNNGNVAVEFLQAGQRYALRQRSTDGTGNSARQLWRTPFWTPQVTNLSDAPIEDDDAHRIGWWQVGLFTDAAGAGAVVADVTGFQLLADDGSVVLDTASVNGGFGIFQRVGGQDYRYACYGPGPVLLETIDLPTGSGWHVADFIIRQGRRGDALTPWLTLRWDGLDVFRERPFGHALLPAPTSYRAAAQSWCAVVGSRSQTPPWVLTNYFRFRQGAFHPDGYPVF